MGLQDLSIEDRNALFVKLAKTGDVAEYTQVSGDDWDVASEVLSVGGWSTNQQCKCFP